MEARNILPYIRWCETPSFCVYHLVFKSRYYTAVQRKMYFFCLRPQNTFVFHIHPQKMLIKAQILGKTCPHLTIMLQLWILRRNLTIIIMNCTSGL